MYVKLQMRSTRSVHASPSFWPRELGLARSEQQLEQGRRVEGDSQTGKN